MARRDWKRVQPRTQAEAIRADLDVALYYHNRSVAQVAELMGTTEWVIYKWLAKGSMPSDRIRPFEYACDPQGRATYLTRFIAASGHKLVIDIPRGRKGTDVEVAALQAAAADAVGLLARFYQGGAGVDATVAALTTLLERAAWHRANVSKSAEPELGLFDEEGE